MTPTRRRVVSVFIGLVLLGQGYAVVRQEVYWPFLRYGMFVGVANDELIQSRLWGVKADGSEVALGNRHFWPLNDAHWWGLRGLQVREGPDAADANLCSLMAWFEKRRSAREDDDWPRLEGLRFYRGFWRVTPTLSGRRDPFKKELLAEVSRAECSRELRAWGVRN